MNTSFSTALPVVPAVLAVRVYNGTPSAGIPSVYANVSLENVTYGTQEVNQTSTTGNTEIAAEEGWYVLSITPAGNQYDSVARQIDLTEKSSSVIIYCLPVATDEANVSNGAPAEDTADLYVTVHPTWAVQGLSEINVTLRNSSSANQTLETLITSDAGTVEFAQLDPGYAYSTVVSNYAPSWEGQAYAYANYTTAPFYIDSGTNSESLTVSPANAWTANVTGSPLLKSGQPGVGSDEGDWLILENTTVEGGHVFLGSDITQSPGASSLFRLTFRNTVVYFDNAMSEGLAPVGFAFVNCTIVMLAEADEFRSSTIGTTIDHTVYFGSATQSWGLQNAFALRDIDSNHSLFADLSGMDSAGVPSTGVFYDTEFVNVGGPSAQEMGFGSAQFLGTTFINSSLRPLGTNNTLNMSDTVFESTAFGYSGSGGSVLDSYLNFSATPESAATGGGFYSGAGHAWRFAHDLITTSVPVLDNYTQVYDGALNSSHKNFWLSLPTDTNISYTRFNFTNYPDVNTTIVTGPHGEMSGYDDAFNANYSRTQVTGLYEAALAGTPRLVPDVIIQVFENLWLNYSTVNLAVMSYIYTQNGNATFSHDIWPYLDWTDDRAAFQGFVGMPTPEHDTLIWQNCTFDYIYDNSTISQGIAKHTSTILFPATTDYINDLNDGLHETTRFLAVNYSTFYPRPLDGSAPGGAKGLLKLGENLVTVDISHDLFLNSDNHTLGPSRFYVPPFGADISVEGGSVTISDTWFLGLNNYTVPIALDNNAGNQGWAGNLTLRDDRFYYAPASGESYVPPYGELLPTMVTASSHVDPALGIANNSTVTYELPGGWNTTIDFESGGQLVSNTTILQAPPPGITSWKPTRSWSVAPDVNSSNGTPTVYFANGEISGPQPNFFWGGYNYSEAVEASYISVGANSSHAPRIYVGYRTLPGRVVNVTEVYAGAVLSTQELVADSRGMVEVPFNPMTEPQGLVVTFQLAPSSGSGGQTGPTLLGLQPGLAYLGLGLIGAVALGALVLVGHRHRRAETPATGQPRSRSSQVDLAKVRRFRARPNRRAD